MKYIPPELNASSFTCPNCGAIANQRWDERAPDFNKYGGGDAKRNIIRIAHCDHCRKYTLWHRGTMVYPAIGQAPPANSEMPESVRKVYEEAESISSMSPRGAAALLRLAIQILCKELGEPGENINDDIAALVKKGLPKMVQQSLDIVRVTGNNAVHPGQIDIDDQDVVANLFGLINVIVEYMITLPNKIGTIYNGLPPGTLSAISKRDKTT